MRAPFVCVIAVSAACAAAPVREPPSPPPPPEASPPPAQPAPAKAPPPPARERPSKPAPTEPAPPPPDPEPAAEPPPAPKAPPAPEPAPRPDPPPVRGEPGPGPKVLIIGDSMVVTELGRDLGRVLEEGLGASVHRKGRSSTGLARPDYYDWFTTGAGLARQVDPDLVVIIVGGNDGQDLVDEAGKGRIRWRTEGWGPAYQGRVHRFLDGMAAEGRRFVWVELPAMDHRNLEGKLRFIRQVQREALAERDDVLLHLDTRPCFYGKDGGLLTRIPTGAKQGGPIRQEDGIHFSLFGARYVSRCAAPQLLDAASKVWPLRGAGSGT